MSKGLIQGIQSCQDGEHAAVQVENLFFTGLQKKLGLDLGKSQSEIFVFVFDNRADPKLLFCNYLDNKNDFQPFHGKLKQW